VLNLEEGPLGYNVSRQAVSCQTVKSGKKNIHQTVVATAVNKQKLNHHEHQEE